jgi:hypothetical protein
MHPGRPSKLDHVADLVLGTAHEDEEIKERPDLALTPARAEALRLWQQECWAFLTGKDPDTGRPILWTRDERDKERPVKPFPAHLDYLHYLIDLLENPPEPILAVEKSSQMIVTTTILLHSAWDCAFHTGRRVMLSKHKEAEAEAILRDKVRFPWEQLPEWLRRVIPVTKSPANRAVWPRTSSQIWGLTENAARAEARGNTYTRGLIDEAEFQDELQATFAAMRPRTDQIVMWSTPYIGGAGTAAFKRFLT